VGLSLTNRQQEREWRKQTREKKRKKLLVKNENKKDQLVEAA